MVISNRHRNGGSTCAEIDCSCRGRSLGCCRLMGCPTIAQLPVNVSSPTLQVAVVENGADEMTVCRDLVVRISKGTGGCPVLVLVHVDGVGLVGRIHARGAADGARAAVDGQAGWERR